MTEEKKEIKKYYIDGEGINDTNIKQVAIKLAASITNSDPTINRVIFYVSKKEKGTQWFDKRKFDSLWENGIRKPNVLLKAESSNTYHKHTIYNDIIIGLGCMGSLLETLEKYNSVKYIISVPWQYELIKDWVDKYNVTKISL
jgi:hypothetical protein